jgi:multidrug efflux pump subunit AcrA (membrane-fusion protein)
MTATVVIIKSITPDQLLVPTSAVHTQGTTKYVIVKNEDGTTTNTDVVTGGSDATNTAITSGLTAGQTIVTGTTTSSNSTSPSAARTTTANTTGEFGAFPGGATGAGPAGGPNSATGGVR